MPLDHEQPEVHGGGEETSHRTVQHPSHEPHNLEKSQEEQKMEKREVQEVLNSCLDRSSAASFPALQLDHESLMYPPAPALHFNKKEPGWKEVQEVVMKERARSRTTWCI